jgi:hypothetical protein
MVCVYNILLQMACTEQKTKNTGLMAKPLRRLNQQNKRAAHENRLCAALLMAKNIYKCD